MYQLLLKSLVSFLTIPLITMALEPNNPTVLCERYLGEADKANCVSKTQSMELDWYASSACSLQDDDGAFMKCLEEIQGARFSPAALELCAKSPDLSDSSRLSCLQKIKNKEYTRTQLKKCSEASSSESISTCLMTGNRAPASEKKNFEFQPLEIKK